MASWAEGLPQYEEESAEQDEETLNDLSLSSSSVDNFELQNSAQELSSSPPTSEPSSASASADDLKALTTAEEEVSKFLQKASSSFSSLSVEKIQEETIKVLKAKAIEQRIEILTLKQKVHELQCQLQSARVALQTSSPATSTSSSPNLNTWSATQTPSEGSSKKTRRRSVNSTHDATINSHRKSEDKLSLNLSSSSSSSSSPLSSSGSSGSSMPPKSPKHKSPRFHKQIPPVPERTNKPNSLSSSANLSSMNMPPTPPPIPEPPKVQEKPVQLLAPVGDEIDSRFLCVVHCKGKEPSMSRYYLGREKGLTEHIQILCRRFHIEENPARFSLRVVAKKHYLTSEDFDFPACYDMPEDKMLSLTLRPEVCVGDALYALQTVSDDNVSQLKMTLYQLRATLAEGDSELGDELIRQGAVEILLKEYQRSKVASIVSLLLGLFNEIMERPSFPWETITPEFIQETVNRSLVVNVQRPALQTLKWIALSPHFGPGIVVQCFKNINSATPLQAIVDMVNSANVDLKVLGLTLLNSFLHFATQQLLHPDTSQAGHELLQSILDEMDRDNINERLKTQIDLVPHIVYNRQLHLYQNYRMWNSFVDFRQKFDENNEEHQQLLGKLWLLSFSDPGDTDLSKVPKGPHRTWLSIGFRSDDPIRHLQSNVLLLKNLVYFTETNQDRVRKATGKQASSLFFPIATASFSITNILCEMLGFSQDLYDSQCKADVYKLLLDDGVKETNRMGELNACVLRMMEHMWGMLKSPSWDDLPGLSQMMTVLVRETLTSFQPETLANFTSLLQKKAKQVMEGTAEDKKKHSGSFFGRIKKPSAPVKKKKIKFKVFGVSLDEIMRNEKLNDPFAEIPTIFTLLRDAIIRHNGAVLEGIFRISVNMDELGRLKERLNNGDYDLQFENAHYPASLLKAWLRELASPLIPCAFYEECINIAGDKEATSSIILKLPEHNYKIVQEIAKLLQLLGRPEHVAKTKMGFPNLALVFAPAFLQPPPGSSASAFLVNSERERMFVESVIEVVK